MTIKTTYDIHRESLTVPYRDPANEKQRNVASLKALIAEKQRELDILLTRLQELESQ